jgi:hypothetical protein
MRARSADNRLIGCIRVLRAVQIILSWRRSSGPSTGVRSLIRGVRTGFGRNPACGSAILIWARLPRRFLLLSGWRAKLALEQVRKTRGERLIARARANRNLLSLHGLRQPRRSQIPHSALCIPHFLNRPQPGGRLARMIPLEVHPPPNHPPGACVWPPRPNTEIAGRPRFPTHHPAVAAKLADRQWTVAELIERTASYVQPAPVIPTLADDTADNGSPEPKRRLTIDDVIPDEE